MSPGMLAAVHWIACMVVLAEALNKLERADLFAGRAGVQRLMSLPWLVVPWRWRRCHIVTALKVCGWLLMSIGAAGGVITPFLRLQAPSMQDVAVVAGFAVLIVRSRVKEG